jgi:hypothetical protein
MRHCTVMDKLTNGLRAPRCPERGWIFTKSVIAGSVGVGTRTSDMPHFLVSGNHSIGVVRIAAE